MNKQKKALFALTMIMILSLSVIQGISKRNIEAKNRNLQQLGGAASYLAGTTEGGTSSTLNYVANTAVGVSSAMVGVGVASIYITGSNPVGWGYWAVTGAVAL